MATNSGSRHWKECPTFVLLLDLLPLLFSLIAGNRMTERETFCAQRNCEGSKKKVPWTRNTSLMDRETYIMLIGRNM